MMSFQFSDLEVYLILDCSTEKKMASVSAEREAMILPAGRLSLGGTAPFDIAFFLS